jgi:hypothetical protein
MTKRKLNLIFLILILILISMAIYSGIEFGKSTTDTMEWQSAKFRITTKTKIFGIGVILSILSFIILGKKVTSH